MNPVSPVIPGHEEIPEHVFAADQPEYLPLPAVIVPGPNGEVITRWKMTDEEKELLAKGGDIYLSLWTFGKPLQPILLRVATADMVMKENREIVVNKDRLQEIVFGDDIPPS
jgi:hypothetical protein